MIDNPYILIGVSVLMHVVWNLLARHVDRKANYLWWGLLTHLVLIAPSAVWQLVNHVNWDRNFIVIIACSAIANVIYFIALRRAYQLAPVSLVYPLARSSPILIAIWMLLFFNVALTMAEWFAICLGIVGLWVLASTTKVKDSSVILWTALAALATSIYSISDKAAVGYLTNFAEQIGFISIGYALSFLSLTVLNKIEVGSYIPINRPPLLFMLVGGLFIGTAYALVVRAMLLLPAAHVVAFTNAGIVIAVLLSIFLFKEKQHWQQRLIGAFIVVISLLILVSVRPN